MDNIIDKTKHKKPRNKTNYKKEWKIRKNHINKIKSIEDEYLKTLIRNIVKFDIMNALEYDVKYIRLNVIEEALREGLLKFVKQHDGSVLTNLKCSDIAHIMMLGKYTDNGRYMATDDLMFMYNFRVLSDKICTKLRLITILNALTDIPRDVYNLIVDYIINLAI